MSRWLKLAVIPGCVLLVFAAAAQAQGSKPASKPVVNLKEQAVFQMVGWKESDTLRISGGGGGMTVKDHNYQIAAKEVSTGKDKSIVIVTDKDGAIAKSVTALKAGDFFTASLTHKGGNPYDFATSFTQYTVRPGEDRPNVFLFAGTAIEKKDSEEITTVKLYKLGAIGTLSITNVRDKASGKMVPDPQIVKAIEGLAVGDSVEVDRSGSAIKSIEPYAAPVTATFSKALQVDVTGGKTPGIEITVGGATTTVLVPGKTLSNGTWSPDGSLSSAIKAFKAGDGVIVRYRADDGKNWLKEITKAPPQPTSK